jgi:hypothetical protein
MSCFPDFEIFFAFIFAFAFREVPRSSGGFARQLGAQFFRLFGGNISVRMLDDDRIPCAIDRKIPKSRAQYVEPIRLRLGDFLRCRLDATRTARVDDLDEQEAPASVLAGDARRLTTIRSRCRRADDVQMRALPRRTRTERRFDRDDARS